MKTYYCMQEKLKRVEKNLKRYVSFESVLEGSEKNWKRIKKDWKDYYFLKIEIERWKFKICLMQKIMN